VQAQTLWDGIIKAFGLSSPNSDSSLPIDAFGCAFRLLAGTGKDYESKAVRSLLQVAMGRLERISQDVGQFSSLGDSERRNQLEFAAYITEVLASLPFVTLDSPLKVIVRSSLLYLALLEQIALAMYTQMRASRSTWIDPRVIR